MSYPRWYKLVSLEGYTWQYVFLTPILLALKKQQATPDKLGNNYGIIGISSCLVCVVTLLQILC